MAEVNSDQAQREDVEGGRLPAVGLIATPGDGDAIAAAILRAQRHGHRTIVTAHRPELEGLEFARQLGATVVSPPPNGWNGTGPQAELATAAREAGFPGLLVQGEPGQTLDFEASKAAVYESEEYVIEAREAPSVDPAPDVMVAIPAFNEEETIADVVQSAQPHAETVVVVDDGSTDATVERARHAGAIVIVHDTNKGYGSALKTAFWEAKRAGAHRLVILDGDGQHDSSDIPKLLSHQADNDAEIVIGSRFRKEAETDLPRYRRLGLRVVNALTNLSLGIVRSRSRIGDTQSGFRVYDRTAIESLATEDSIGDHMGASTDILYHANQEGYDMAEIGTTIRYNGENTNSHPPVSHGIHLVSNILRTVEQERPVTILGVPGFLSTLVGLGFAYATFSQYIAAGVFPLGLAIVSVFFSLAGIFAAFTAIILHSLKTHSPTSP